MTGVERMGAKYYERFFKQSPKAYSCIKVIFNKKGEPVDFQFLSVNRAYEKLMGLKNEQIIGKKYYELFPTGWEGEANWIDDQKNAIVERKLFQFDIKREDLEKWIRVILFPIENDVFGFIHEDVTKEYLLDEEIEGFIKVNIDLLCVSDYEGRVIRTNQAVERVLGYNVEEVEGMNLLQLVHPDDLEMTKEAMKTFEKERSLSRFVNRFRTKDGTYVYLEWYSKPTGKYIYSSARDVTEKREMELKLKESNEHLQKVTARLKQLVDRDELTGLYNRHYLYENINEAIKSSDRNDTPLTLIIFDLDHFKRVNDTWGHPVGDKVLQEVAKIPGQFLGEEDFIVRLGGEEFMAVLKAKNLAEGRKIAEKIRCSIEKHQFPIDGTLTASFGVAERLEMEHFYSWYERADEALYIAKRTGRNKVVLAWDSTHLDCSKSPILWKKELECGWKEIDDQHKELYELANMLIRTSVSKKDRGEVLAEIDLALDRIEHHFRSEEKMIEEIGAPGVKEHTAEHHLLSEKLSHLRELYAKGEVKLSAVYTFIIDEIIIHHTEKFDLKYFPFVKRYLKKVLGQC